MRIADEKPENFLNWAEFNMQKCADDYEEIWWMHSAY